jgi:hypothetical protein
MDTHAAEPDRAGLKVARPRGGIVPLLDVGSCVERREE